MADERHCNECGGKLPGDAPQGLCPQCLMKLGLPSEAGRQGPVEKGNQAAVPTSATPPGGFIPPQPDQLAEKFPQLEITELLGQGGMGAVYKARQKQLDRLVALKILPPEVGQDPAFAERFSREARSLAKLNHSRIVSIFDFGHTQDGLYYFIMEYVDGTDLRHVIEGGHLESSEALAIVPQICEALQYAHEEGLVHRDIKPENILLDKKGKVKIADFGLAKLLGKPATAYTLTQAGQRMGTPHYMAPEQIEGAHQVDHRADIYSLGVVFYEMLTGQLPIGRFAPPSQKVQVDVRLDDVVLKSLEHEPEQRYQKVSEVKTEIESIRAEDSDAKMREPHLSTKPVSLIVRHTDVYAGFAEAHGILRFEGDDLNLEYKIEDGIFGIIKSSVKTAQIPLDQVVSIKVQAGRRKTKLTLRTSTWKALDNVPGSKAGLVTLEASTKDNASVSHFIERLEGRLPDGTIVGYHGKQTDSNGDVDNLLDGPAKAMMTGGILLMACVAPTAVPFLVDPGFLHRFAADEWSVETIVVAILVIMQIVAMPVGGVITSAAKNLKRRQSYGFAVAAGILMLLPLGVGSFIGIPLGIWVLVELNREEVRALFQTKPADLSRQGRWNGFCIIAFLLSLVAGLMSIREFDPGDEVRDRIISMTAVVLSLLFAVIGLWRHAKYKGMRGISLGIGAIVIALAAFVGFFVTIYYPISW